MERRSDVQKSRIGYADLFDEPAVPKPGASSGSHTLIRKLQVLLDFFDYVPGGFLVLDRSGVMLSCNQHLADLLMTPRNEILGKSLYPFVIPSHRDRFYLHLRQVFVRQKPAIDELMLENRGGEFCWMHLRSFSDLSPHGRRECRSILTDITELKRAQVQLTKQSEEVERLNRRLRALAMEMSRVEQRERKRLAEVLHDHLQQILVSAMMQLSHGKKIGGGENLHPLIDRVAGFLQEAVELSRSLSVDLCPPVLNEAGLSQGLEWLAGRMAKRNGFRVTVTEESPVEPIPEEIRIFCFESVRELLLNAVKHSGADGAEINLHRPDADHVRITVKDRGRGFDTETLHGSIDGDGGTFGLFSIQERMNHLGGTLEIESEEGIGCCATLTVCLKKASPLEADGAQGEKEPQRAEEEPPREGPSEEEPRETVRILIVDDHKVLREGLVSMIEMTEGLEVAGEAADGKAAIEQAGALKPDVILMDVNLPQVNGVQATRTICERHPEIRVIGLSMHIEEGVAQAMKAAGAADYLTKDGSVESIIRCIRKATA